MTKKMPDIKLSHKPQREGLKSRQLGHSPQLEWDQLLKVREKRGFPHSSVGKESACNAGDPGSIPGPGKYAGEGIGYPLQYSWASLVTQLVKNLPAMKETWVRSLGWEDPLEKGKAIHSSTLAWRIPWTIQSMGLQRVEHDSATFTSVFKLKSLNTISYVFLTMLLDVCNVTGRLITNISRMIKCLKY